MNGKTIANRTDSICPNTVAELVTTHLTDAGTEYTWTAVPADLTMTTNNASAIISPKVTTTYYVKLTQECEAIDSVTIHIASPMKVEVEKTPACGSVLLTASTSTAGATFEWTLNGVLTTGATLHIDNNTAGSDRGTVTVIATSTDACVSDPLEVSYELPTLSVVIDGSPSVCPGGSTQLEAIPSSADTSPGYTYQWYNGSTAIAGATTATLPNAVPGSYRVTVKTQYCEKDTTHTITEGSGEISGTLTVNGETIIGSPRIYGSCGEELVIKADYVSDNGIFKWSSSPADATLSAITGNTITVQPAGNTKYFLEFENQCTAYDTIHIELKPQATLSVSQAKSCGKTILTATPDETLFNAVYTWTVDGIEQGETGSQIEITENAAVTTSVRSAEYCPGEEVTTSVTIDTLSVEIAEVAPVCSGQQVELTATTATSAIQTPQYRWFKRPAGTVLSFEEISGATSAVYTNPSQTESTEYRVTVTAGECTAEATVTVEILTAALSGTITADGNTISSVNGTKTYPTCGMPPIALAATHTATDESSFAWTSVPSDNTMTSSTGREITVHPSVTTTYIVRYENNCMLSDTVIVEVHPLTASADWSEFTEPKCEGATLTVPLHLTGYDANAPGSYIKWYKGYGTGREELTQHAGKTALVIDGSTVDDSGRYSYEVSNGICHSSQFITGDDVQDLKVKPVVKFTLPQTAYTVIRGGEVTLQATEIRPDDAAITWTDGSVTHSTNPAVITNITHDQTWTVKAGGEDYCPSEKEITIQVDARPAITIALEGNDNKICRGAEITLTADTTGTGKLLNPSDYKIVWQKEENGSYTQIGENSASLTLTPDATARYRAEVTYGSQQITSGKIEVEVYPSATYDLLTPSPTTCSGDEITIGIENLQPANATVKWDSESTITSSDLTSLQITVRPSDGTIKVYSFTVDQAGLCSQRGTVSVTIEHPISYTLSGDTSVCEGEPVKLTARAPEGTSFQWTNRNDGEPAGTDASLEIIPKESVTYAVTMTSGGACPPVTGTVSVEVSSSPEITAIIPVRIREVEIQTSPDAGRPPFLYKIGEEEYTPENTVNVRYFDQSYTYTVQDANGCKTTLDYTLKSPAINPPIIFTPDGNGENDTWEVPELADAYPDAVITIYDRFGKKLVEMNAENGSWDGTYLGKPMPSTDYWYEISVAEIDKIYIGHFTLLR